MSFKVESLLQAALMIEYNNRKFDSINIFNYGKNVFFAHLLPISYLTERLISSTKAAVNVTFNNGRTLLIIHNDYGKKYTVYIGNEHTNDILSAIISAHRAQLLQLDP